MPSTMKNYIMGIRRSFQDVWGYRLKFLTGPVFDCPRRGLTSLLDNKPEPLQEKGTRTQHHNTLSRYDLILLFKSRSLCLDTPNSYQNRPVFTTNVLRAMILTSMALLKRQQFVKMGLNERWCQKLLEALVVQMEDQKHLGWLEVY